MNCAIPQGKRGKELTPGEKKLRSQYRNIRILGVLAQLGGILVTVLSVVLCVRFMKDPLALVKGPALLFAFGIFYIVVGSSLRRYRLWSWWAFVIIQNLLVVLSAVAFNPFRLLFSGVFLWAIASAKGWFRSVNRQSDTHPA